MSVTVRALSAEEARSVTAGRLVAVELAPYLAHALFTARPVAAEGLGTCAVDQHWRCYIDPAVLAEWSAELLGGVLVHEVGHLVRDHADRACELGVASPVKWNYATDAAINDDLIAAGIPLPNGVVTPGSLGLDPGGVEETYYAALVTDPPPGSEDTAPDDGEGCGSGAGDPTAVWELPGDDTTVTVGVSEVAADTARRRVAEAVAEAAGAGRGTVPAGWQRWADDALRAPTVPWQQVLGAAVRRPVAWARGRSEYTYLRPSRRRIPGVLTPGMVRPVVTAAAVLDTSASMRPDQLAAALGEVEGIIRAAGNPRGLTVLACDADVAETVTVAHARDLPLTGGGGTDMRAGIAAAEALRPAPDVIVVVTDGMTPWPQEPTRARLIVAVVGEYPDDDVPEWASVVRIPTDAPA